MKKTLLFILVPACVGFIIGFFLLPGLYAGAQKAKPVIIPRASSTSTITNKNFSELTYDGTYEYSCDGAIQYSMCIVEGGWITYVSTQNGTKATIKVDTYNDRNPDSVLIESACSAVCTNKITGRVFNLPACGERIECR